MKIRTKNMLLGISIALVLVLVIGIIIWKAFSVEDATKSQEITEPEEGIEVEFDAILNGNKKIVDFETAYEVTVDSLPSINSSYRGNADRYTTLDLDEDGVLELILEYDVGGDTAIIKKQQDKWYAYYVPHRGILQLKTDGTMLGSGGAGSGSIRKLTFTKNGIEYEDIVVYDYSQEVYFVNGSTVSSDEITSALEIQSQKEDAQFIDLD